MPRTTTSRCLSGSVRSNIETRSSNGKTGSGIVASCGIEGYRNIERRIAQQSWWRRWTAARGQHECPDEHEARDAKIAHGAMVASVRFDVRLPWSHELD